VGGLPHPPAVVPPGKTRYPLYRRLGGTLGRSGRMRKNSLAPGFNPPTVQPVASRYTDWAIPAHILIHAVAWFWLMLLASGSVEATEGWQRCCLKGDGYCHKPMVSRRRWLVIFISPGKKDSTTYRIQVLVRSSGSVEAVGNLARGWALYRLQNLGLQSERYTEFFVN